MTGLPWILISIAIVLILLAILLIIAFKNQKRKALPDYYNIFIIGLIWLAIGVIGIFSGNNVFFIIGLVFALIGWAHRKEWKQNRKSWMNMENRERRIIAIIMIVLLIIVLAGIVLFLLLERGTIW